MKKQAWLLYLAWTIGLCNVQANAKTLAAETNDSASISYVVAVSEGERDGEPLAGALVVLLDETGAAVGNTLTTGDGVAAWEVKQGHEYSAMAVLDGYSEKWNQSQLKTGCQNQTCSIVMEKETEALLVNAEEAQPDHYSPYTVYVTNGKEALCDINVVITAARNEKTTRSYGVTAGDGRVSWYIADGSTVSVMAVTDGYDGDPQKAADLWYKSPYVEKLTLSPDKDKQ